MTDTGNTQRRADALQLSKFTVFHSFSISVQRFNCLLPRLEFKKVAVILLRFPSLQLLGSPSPVLGTPISLRNQCGPLRSFQDGALFVSSLGVANDGWPWVTGRLDTLSRLHGRMTVKHSQHVEPSQTLSLVLWYSVYPSLMVFSLHSS